MFGPELERPPRSPPFDLTDNGRNTQPSMTPPHADPEFGGHGGAGRHRWKLAPAVQSITAQIDEGCGKRLARTCRRSTQTQPQRHRGHWWLHMSWSPPRQRRPEPVVPLPTIAPVLTATADVGSVTRTGIP